MRAMHTTVLGLLAMAATGATVSRGAAYTVHVVEPAITDHLILEDGPLPPVCQVKSSIKLSGCRGQYEPASFVVTTTTPLEAVRVEVGPLSGAGGQWPQEAIDVRVVKEYFTRTAVGPAAPVPMLLVHDDRFLAIEPDPTPEDPGRMKNVARGPLRDAARLAPVDIDTRRQFWVTVHVPEDANAGTYRTTVRIVPAQGEPAELELEVEVYPFELRDPMLEYSIYYPVRLVPDGSDDWRSGQWSNIAALHRAQYLAECRNMLAHGLSNPNIYAGVGVRPDGTLDSAALEEILAVREEAGIGPGVPLYAFNGAAEPVARALTEAEKLERARLVRQVMAWARGRGYPDMYWAAQDEAWGDWLSSERDSFQAIHDGGGKVFVACGADFFPLVGDLLHRPVMHVDIATPLDMFGKQRGLGPAEALSQNAQSAAVIGVERWRNHANFRRAIDGVHRLGRRIFTYTTLRPQLAQWQRRHEGLGLWRIGFDGVMNWSYAHIKGDGANQAMYFAMVFRVDGGVLDTLHWEGLRAGVDDVRYLTTLLATLDETLGRFPDETLVAETQQWLRKLDVAAGDLDAIRREMAQRIVALDDLGHKDLTPAELLQGVDVERIEIVALDEPWRFRLIELDQAALLGPGAAGADRGLNEKWFDPATDDGQWTPMRAGTGYTREAGGGWGNQSGIGWYRTAIPLPAARRARPFKYLHFGACDEDAWVYVNGRLVLEHSVETTGMLVSEIWQAPFVVPLNDLALKGDDLLAVRVRNTESMGGIWKPVHLVVSDQALSDGQVKALIELRAAKE